MYKLLSILNYSMTVGRGQTEYVPSCLPFLTFRQRARIYW
ncbi:hypothetical protein BACCAP_04825 [Pseudoflavonifractor capillosus ATCC 29799]|uniref:Uncharacterized protein n=1 Tax=Pseudoflavonifractor capillosus ATCC 29799 TaxID=411467 RepID=A6P2U2_9FIRM|nr:hypothetical protein BACCAP_04825 [Pseudoflavonifractor capillosus ATCC 29799]